MKVILSITHHIYYYFYHLFMSFHPELPLLGKGCATLAPTFTRGFTSPTLTIKPNKICLLVIKLHVFIFTYDL
jgi:hypothetical protein